MTSVFKIRRARLDLETQGSERLKGLGIWRHSASAGSITMLLYAIVSFHMPFLAQETLGLLMCGPLAPAPVA